jgi:uncharacterized membrane protein
MLVSSTLGIGSAMTTVVEKIALLKDPGQAAFCDINSQIGCTPVLLSPQSSVLGPPNAAIGMVMFSMFAAAALAGVMGAWFPRSYAIGSLCPFCAVCAGCVMVVVLAAIRLCVVEAQPGDRGFAGVLASMVRSGLDIIVVAGWTALIAGMLVVGIML